MISPQIIKKKKLYPQLHALSELTDSSIEVS